MLSQRGIANMIAGGWELTTTALARTGFPVNVLLPSSYTAPDGATGTERPDRIPGISLTPPGGRTVAEWINPAAFALPAGEFGTAPRNLISGAGTWQIDMGAGKTFPLSERGRLEFRAEFFNIFNHPTFALPYNVVGTSSFGQILSTFGSTLGFGVNRQIQLALKLKF